MPNIGELRHRIFLQQVTETADSFGEPDESWSTVGPIYAKITPLRGEELARARQISASVSHSVWLRYRTGVIPKMRLLYGERIFEIESVLNWNERGRWLELTCHEVI